MNDTVGTKKLVLVIEDDKFYSNIFKTKFDQEGIKIALAGNGLEGLDLAKKQHPDLILLDLIMPVKDGFETLAELKADPDLKEIPVIVLSNLGQIDDVNKAKAMGAKDYLIKANISLQEAVEMVKKYL